MYIKRSINRHEASIENVGGFGTKDNELVYEIFSDICRSVFLVLI